MYYFFFFFPFYLNRAQIKPHSSHLAKTKAFVIEANEHSVLTFSTLPKTC